MLSALLILGLIFPVMGWMSLLLMRNGSVAGVPLIGPILLSVWIVLSGHPLWIIPIVWITDIGSLNFYSMLWYCFIYSRFTQVWSLRGKHDSERVNITFHYFGRYRYGKIRNNPQGHGTMGFNEAGSYTRNEEHLELTSSRGSKRSLHLQSDNSYLVIKEELGTDVSPFYSISEWILTRY